VPSDGGLDRLTNPPDRVRNKLHATIGIEFPGGGHQTEVTLADEIDQRHAPILELLGYRNHEPHIVASQPFLGSHVALERLAGKLHLLLTIEEGDPTDLVQVEVETLTAFIDCTSDLRRSHRATLATCFHRHAVCLLQDSRPARYKSLGI